MTKSTLLGALPPGGGLRPKTQTPISQDPPDRIQYLGIYRIGSNQWRSLQPIPRPSLPPHGLLTPPFCACTPHPRPWAWAQQPKPLYPGPGPSSLSPCPTPYLDWHVMFWEPRAWKEWAPHGRGV